jgi:hypothetical protein
MELFQRSVAPLVLKFGIHQGQTRRKGVRRGEEEGMSIGGQKASIVRNLTTKLDWAAVYYPHVRTRAKTTCCLH